MRRVIASCGHVPQKMAKFNSDLAGFSLIQGIELTILI